MQYRPEIDGLRAIAVFVVVAYHVNDNFFPGGFIGVDIFFVLSGFLISSIILAEKKDPGAFSFTNFYNRRFKRIMPPLWPVIFFSVAVGLFLFNTENFQSLSWSALSASVFSANHYFALNTSYFHNPGESSLLLHLWSLSVEEQFYLIWPIVLLGIMIYKCGDGLKLTLLTICALFSYMGAHLMASTGRFETAAFYFLPPRSGELLTGAILAFYQNSAIKQVKYSFLGWLGMGLMLTPIFVYSNTTLFPGFSALLPCIGVVLVLSQFPTSSLLYRKVLGNRYGQYGGKISYFIYGIGHYSHCRDIFIRS